MKRYLAAVLLFMPVLMTGCMGEDWSICGPDENCLLRFRYLDENGADAFRENIGAVDVMLFDGTGHLAAQFHRTQAELEELRGINILLDPGDYYAVAWGNISSPDNTKLTTLTESTLEIAEGGSGQPLYYAPYMQPITRSGGRPDSEMSIYKITVPNKGVVERDLAFTRAHRSINVFIKGYEDSANGQDPELQVEVTHLAYAYDFMLRVEPVRRNHRSKTEIKTTPAGDIPGVTLNTPYQEIEDEINIKITAKDGRQVGPTINLKEFLLAEGKSLDALTLHEITILMEFKDGEVSITLTGWKDNDVDPLR